MTGVVDLDDARCTQLLGAGTFGRMAVMTSTGPEIVPVNYRVVVDEVTVRTSASSLLARYADRSAVCFEVDLVDYERWIGWSVVARGVSRVVDVSAHDVAAGGPRPWVESAGDVVVKLRWTSLSGRQIGAGWDALLAMPARTAPR